MMFPGWDSLESVSRIHNALQLAGIAFLGLLVLSEGFAYVYSARKDTLTNVASSPRHLNDFDKKNLIRVFTPLIQNFPSLKIGAPGDGEAQGYAKEFATVFNQIGIKVDRVGFLIPTSAGIAPLQIVVKDLNHIPPKAEQFAEALVAAGFKPVGGIFDNLTDDDFEFVVGPKK